MLLLLVPFLLLLLPHVVQRPAELLHEPLDDLQEVLGVALGVLAEEVELTALSTLFISSSTKN